MRNAGLALTFVSAVAFLVLLVSCGPGKRDEFKARRTQPPASAGSAGGSGGAVTVVAKKGSNPYPFDKGVVTLAGVVKLDKVPARKPVIGIDADPKCAAMHKGTPMLEETEVVDKETLGIRDCIVYVSDGVNDYAFDTPTEAVIIDQHGCMYVPHVFTIMVDQPLTFRNSDPTAHNVHGPTFNLNQPKQGQEDTVKLEDPGIGIGTKCDIHPWMNCQTGVFFHPFHAVTNEKGEFKIGTKLIPGKYKVTVWHAKYGSTEQEFEVKEGESGEKRLDEFQFKR